MSAAYLIFRIFRLDALAWSPAICQNIAHGAGANFYKYIIAQYSEDFQEE